MATTSAAERPGTAATARDAESGGPEDRRSGACPVRPSPVGRYGRADRVMRGQRRIPPPAAATPAVTEVALVAPLMVPESE